MDEILQKAYAISYDLSAVSENVSINQHNYHYIISLNNDESFHLEEIQLAYHLMRSGELQIAKPIRNIHGNWFTPYKGEKVIVFEHEESTYLNMKSEYKHGRLLAKFHKRNRIHLKSQEKYEHINSFNQWHTFWLQRMTYYEENIKKHEYHFDKSYKRLFPYMLSLTENAIQYINELKNEQRRSQIDVPTVAFKRYDLHILNKVILPTDLIIDHPMRDIAECLRNILFYEQDDISYRIRKFIEGYESIEPLSLHSWRLIYSRLLYPAHYYDLLYYDISLERSYNKDVLNTFIKRQTRYEKRLAQFFSSVGIEPFTNRIPTVEWLLY